MPRNKDKKRRRSQKRKIPLERGIASSNTAIIPLIATYDADLSAPFAHGFGFTTAALWVNGTSTLSITGASEVAAVFDLMRIKKVEITAMPTFNVLMLTDSGMASTNSLPYIYDAFDPNDSTNPSESDIMQLASVRVGRFDTVKRRTIYPNLLRSSAAVDLRGARNNEFVKSGDNTLQWAGYKMYIKSPSADYPYAYLRVFFKIFFECTASK